MRILHFADLHIGVENYGRTDPQTGLSTRLIDFLSTLDELVEYALSQDVDVVILAGDAYKGRDPSQTHQRELATRLAKLSAAGIPVFLLVGNHDLPHAVGRATAIEIFHTLQVPGLYVGDKLQTYTIPTRSGGPLQIVAVPWPRRSGLLSREESRGITIDQVNEKIQDLFTESIQNRIAELDPSIPAVLAGHVTISAARTGTEQSMMLGQDHVLLPSAVHKPELDYVALGHIHKHQVLRENPLVVYSGSLQRVDFSEEDDNKGFCVVDLDPSAPQGRRLQDFRFQPVNARPFLTIEAKVSPGDEDPTDTVMKAIMRRNVAGSIVRLRVSLPAEAGVHLREGEIREALSGAHYLAAITRDVEQDRRTRIPPGVADDGLAPLDVLRLYLESRTVTPDRQEKLLKYAEDLISIESSDPSQAGRQGTGL
ncbi:MAG: exonuclease SbcCD subunit D [Dehalococcoidia bacterium]|nr:exonuclease SbcCD subunit D [Dehalococcoidia bacterium]